MIDNLRNLATSLRIYQRNKQGRKFEPEAPFMKEVVKPGDICLHFGGSDGRHSYLLSQHTGPAGRVHVYEPSNYSFAIMSRLIRWHKLRNVTPHNAAIGATEGTMLLSVPRKMSGHFGRAYGVVTDAGGSASDEKLATGNQTEFVDQPTAVVSLDGLMAAEGLSQVDFIRCDVEGAEIRLIEGGRNTIERDLPSLLIEIHPFSLQRNFGSSAEAVRDYFTNLGYRMWQLNDDDTRMFESTRIDPKRRWKDYFLIHPSRGPSLPEGMFRKAFAS
ncbi:MAG: FkbM family methyltransferase [Alphaproteobacteria bacterium]|nr:FkbM family methyltransferase [Alphaproteobacteria bacterium]